MNTTKIKVLLADDDLDDINFFKKAIEELKLSIQLITLGDGEELMRYLNQNLSNLPDVIFLDLSMPRKTGFECLTEIKENSKLKMIPVTVFTTSFTKGLDFEDNMKHLLTKIGADDYIRKPNSLEELKLIIQTVILKVLHDEKHDKENKSNS